MDQSYSGHLFPALPSQSLADPARMLVAEHLDAAFYLHRYGDVRDAGADPAGHYCDTGWREGRDPADWFDTGYYLGANPDIRDAGLNPFWHYLAQGRREGRAPQPPGARLRRELAQVLPAADPVESPPAGLPVLDSAGLRHSLLHACAGARGVAVALSHDRYIEVPGGTQLLIADEQRKFNGDGVAYLHLSPAAPRLGLAAPGSAPLWLAVILDGAVLGAVLADGAIAALMAEDLPEARLLVVHNLHGHRPEDVAALAGALRPARALFWAHDYGAGCGSPRLLRNDIAFCAAPPPDSMACRICAHGAERAAHLGRMRALFESVPFTLVAPSDVAQTWWLRATGLTPAGMVVHPHVELAPTAPAERMAAPDMGPVRVAFIGHAAFHKGWGVFRDLALAARMLGAYEFFQFASPAELQPRDGITAVAAETSPRDPFGMQRAIAACGIDLVLALSPWPETFGYVPHEAIAAGAAVVTTEASGNVAALIHGTGHGKVLDTPEALLDCFRRLGAARFALTRRRSAAHAPRLRHVGSSATLGGGLTSDPDLHLLCGGVRVDGEAVDAGLRFTLPPGARLVELRSRRAYPVWEQAVGADGRVLGAAVAALTLDDVALALDDVRLGHGWHAPEPGWRWTDGRAVLDVTGAAALTAAVLPIAQYWSTGL
jgi:hypothetical protein